MKNASPGFPPGNNDNTSFTTTPSWPSSLLATGDVKQSFYPPLTGYLGINNTSKNVSSSSSSYVYDSTGQIAQLAIPSATSWITNNSSSAQMFPSNSVTNQTVTFGAVRNTNTSYDSNHNSLPLPQQQSAPPVNKVYPFRFFQENNSFGQPPPPPPPILRPQSSSVSPAGGSFASVGRGIGRTLPAWYVQGHQKQQHSSLWSSMTGSGESNVEHWRHESGSSNAAQDELQPKTINFGGVQANSNYSATEDYLPTLNASRNKIGLKWQPPNTGQEELQPATITFGGGSTTSTSEDYLPPLDTSRQKIGLKWQPPSAKTYSSSKNDTFSTVDTTPDGSTPVITSSGSNVLAVSSIEKPLIGFSEASFQAKTSPITPPLGMVSSTPCAGDTTKAKWHEIEERIEFYTAELKQLMDGKWDDKALQRMKMQECLDKLHYWDSQPRPRPLFVTSQERETRVTQQKAHQLLSERNTNDFITSSALALPLIPSSSDTILDRKSNGSNNNKRASNRERKKNRNKKRKRGNNTSKTSVADTKSKKHAQAVSKSEKSQEHVGAAPYSDTEDDLFGDDKQMDRNRDVCDYDDCFDDEKLFQRFVDAEQQNSQKQVVEMIPEQQQQQQQQQQRQNIDSRNPPPVSLNLPLVKEVKASESMINETEQLLDGEALAPEIQSEPKNNDDGLYKGKLYSPSTIDDISTLYDDVTNSLSKSKNSLVEPSAVETAASDNRQEISPDTSAQVLLAQARAKVKEALLKKKRVLLEKRRLQSEESAAGSSASEPLPSISALLKGGTDSLHVTNINSSGSAEKVHFITSDSFLFYDSSDSYDSGTEGVNNTNETRKVPTKPRLVNLQQRMELTLRSIQVRQQVIEAKEKKQRLEDEAQQQQQRTDVMPAPGISETTLSIENNPIATVVNHKGLTDDGIEQDGQSNLLPAQLPISSKTKHSREELLKRKEDAERHRAMTQVKLILSKTELYCAKQREEAQKAKSKLEQSQQHTAALISQKKKSEQNIRRLKLSNNVLNDLLAEKVSLLVKKRKQLHDLREKNLELSGSLISSTDENKNDVC